MSGDPEEAHRQVVPVRPLLAELVRTGMLELKGSVEREAEPGLDIGRLPLRGITAVQELEGLSLFPN